MAGRSFEEALPMIVGLGVGAAAVAATIGAAADKRQEEWFAGAMLLLVLTVWVVLMHYLITPWLKSAGRWRAEVISGERAARRAASKRKPYGVLTIESADYGNTGTYVSVTDVVRGHVKKNLLSVPATNEALGGDPLPNVWKVLIVTYHWDDRSKRTASVMEGDTLQIP